MQLPPPVHGAAVVNQNVARSARLASRFRIDVLPMRFADSIADMTSVSPRKLMRAAGVAARLVGALVARRPDAVYFTLSPSGGAFYRDCLYVAIIKTFGVRRIYHMHGKGVAEQLHRRWKRALYAWAFRDAWVIHLSPSLTADVAPVVPKDRLFHVPNGVADGGGPPSTRREHSGPPRVLFLSNMIEAKGPLVLLEALGLLKQRGLEFEATFAGAASHGDCVEAFKSGVARLNLADRVRYVGPVFGEEKHALFQGHDVFAFPTYNDAFPLVVLEAMEWQLPVITTLEGALPDIIEEGETGFLVPQRDVEALASRLALLIENPQLCAHMGQRGRARYLEHFTLHHFEDKLAETLDQCLDGVR